MLARSLWLLLLASRVFGQQFAFIPVRDSPRPIVGAVLQDHLGRLWLRTNKDLECFDGSHFFSLLDYGLPALTIPNGSSTSNIAEDSQGGIWFIWNSGLNRFADGRVERISDRRAFAIVSLAPGLLLAAFSSKAMGLPTLFDLYRIREAGKEWRVERLPDVNMRGDGFLTVDHHGTALYPCVAAWCELTSTAVAAWRAGLPLTAIRHPDVYHGIESVLRDRFGCLWFRSVAGAQYQCPGDLKPRPLPLEIASNGISLFEASDGSIVIPSDLGVAIGRPQSFQLIKPVNGLPLVEGPGAVGPDGTVWLVGTKGLMRLANPFRLEFWTEREGLSAPFSILRVDGHIYASSGLGISVLSGDRDRWLALKPSAGLGVIRSMTRGPGETILAVPQHNGVVELALDGRTIARSPPGQGSDAMAITRSGDGQIFLAGAGASRVTIQATRVNILPEPLPGVHALGADVKYQSSTHETWACYQAGLAVESAGRWQVLSSQQGILEACRSLATLPDGDVWLGYNTVPAIARVHQIATGRYVVRQYWTSEESGRGMVRFFDTDSSHRLWRGTTNGVFVANPAEAVADKWIELNSKDGLPETDTNQQGFLADADGSVWFAAGNTITHFDPPPDFDRPSFAPHIFISGFSWNGARPILSEKVKSLPFRAASVAHIGSLQFDRRNAMRLRYRFLPEQSEWSETRNLDIPLGRPRSGSHTLEVQAKLFTGPWSNTSSHSFNVLKPLWLTWPMILAVLATSSAMGFAMNRWRVTRKFVAARSLPDLAEWRLLALSPEARDIVGTTLDKQYAIDRVLARGGFATVFHGRDLHRAAMPVAIKIFRQETADKISVNRQFRREVKSLEQIDHPNVVRILAHGVTPSGAPYLVMELISGTTLREQLDAGPLSFFETAAYLRQIAAALAEIHHHGIYHRDVKPENLMLRSGASVENQLVLIDFSIAIVKQPDETIHGISRAAGTIYYMAPEQAIGYADAATDIYSLAKVVIEMLTGSRLSLLLPDAAMDLPHCVRELLVSLPVRLNPSSIDLLSSALEFDPGRRPRDVRAFASPIVLDLQNGAEL